MLVRFFFLPIRWLRQPYELQVPRRGALFALPHQCQPPVLLCSWSSENQSHNTNIFRPTCKIVGSEIGRQSWSTGDYQKSKNITCHTTNVIRGALNFLAKNVEANPFPPSFWSSTEAANDFYCQEADVVFSAHQSLQDLPSFSKLQAKGSSKIWTTKAQLLLKNQP